MCVQTTFFSQFLFSQGPRKLLFSVAPDKTWYSSGTDSFSFPKPVLPQVLLHLFFTCFAALATVRPSLLSSDSSSHALSL